LDLVSHIVRNDDISRVVPTDSRPEESHTSENQLKEATLEHHDCLLVKKAFELVRVIEL